MKLALRILLITAIAALVCAYIAGYNLMKGKFLPHTFVNGVEYSGMTSEEAEALFRSAYAGRILEITERGGAVEKVSYDDIGYRIRTGQTFQELIDAQNYYAWPLSYVEKTRLVTKEAFEYSETKLKDALRNLDAVKGDQVKLPTDAYIVKTGNGYEIKPETEGSRVIFKKLVPVVEEAVNNSETKLNIEEAGCYMRPSVYADDETLNSQLASILKVQETEITIAMEGNVFVKLDKSTFLPWLDFENGTLSVSDDKVFSYTTGLAEQYDTYMHKRKFVTYEGDTVEVGGGNYDNYGYQMNREKSAQLIRDALMSGTTQTIAIEWDKYARTRDESGSDFGSTYIEISLDQQHMWYHKDGEVVVSTPVVTGTATMTRATPPGCFQILQMLKDHVMQGSYGESFANYVLAICTNGIAIHDSSWRSDYGYDIWLYSGSHGCINTPYSAVEKIYNDDAMGYGIPVIIYDRNNTVPEIHNELYTGGEHETEEEYYDEEYYDGYDYDYDDYDYESYYDEDEYYEDEHVYEETEVYDDGGYDDGGYDDGEY